MVDTLPHLLVLDAAHRVVQRRCGIQHHERGGIDARRRDAPDVVGAQRRDDERWRRHETQHEAEAVREAVGQFLARRRFPGMCHAESYCGDSAETRGRYTMNVDPAPAVLSAAISPPDCLMMP